MSVDIAEFLAARMAEDEAAANAATPGPWRVHDMGTDPPTVDGSKSDGHMIAEMYACGDDHHDGRNHADAAHIVRHDPARVLREAAAKRAVLALHRPNDEPGPGRACTYCGHLWPCAEVRITVSIWQDHAEYDPSWRP